MEYKEAVNWNSYDTAAYKVETVIKGIILKEKLRHLFFLSYYSDIAHQYAMRALEVCRHEAEKSDCLQGFSNNIIHKFHF